MMAMAAEGTGDNRQVKEQLERALALDENYIPSRVALARLHVARLEHQALQRLAVFGGEVDRTWRAQFQRLDVVVVRHLDAPDKLGAFDNQVDATVGNGQLAEPFASAVLDMAIEISEPIMSSGTWIVRRPVFG